MQTLQEQLKIATEGLAQMQQPDAGYFEDPTDPQPEELRILERDVMQQCKAIEKIINRIEKEDQR